MSAPAPAQQLGGPPPPRVKTRSGPSLVWLIPLITALIGGWLVFHTLSQQGPRITIGFKTAEGIEAGKTRIKYKNIEIGVVESLRFTEDFKSVVVHADMAREAEPFLRRGTRFWVVRPRLDMRGVSGLGTLLSGAYIEIEPGRGAFQTHFDGLESPPVVRAEDEGKRLVLMAEGLGSIDIGSPIYYQGILAGEVLGYELSSDQKNVFIHAFVKAPYSEMVRGNTRFWNISGLDVTVDAQGLRVRTESVQSLLFGGIAFSTPDTLEPAAGDVADLVFTLHESRTRIEEQTYTRKVRFVLFFEGSVRGLAIDAPVEFKGIKVGRVVDVRLEYDQRDTSFRIPVLIEIEPERVIARGGDADQNPQQVLETLVEQGLRARLQMGNLLTGQLFVELDMRPDLPARLVSEGKDIPELPTIPGRLEQLTGSLRSVLAKLEAVELDKIGAALQGSLEGADRLLNSADARQALGGLNDTLALLRSTLGQLDARAGPIAANMEKALGTGHQALERIELTMNRFNEVLAQDSPSQYRFNQMTEELAEMARSIRHLVDLLERDPQSIIFGKQPPRGQ